jgi:hypothetical protein
MMENPENKEKRGKLSPLPPYIVTLFYELDINM